MFSTSPFKARPQDNRCVQQDDKSMRSSRNGKNVKRANGNAAQQEGKQLSSHYSCGASSDFSVTRLSDYQFTDICFNGEEKDIFLRGCIDSNLPLRPPPENLMEDCSILMSRVIQRGKKDKEFFIDYDDVRYRVARADTIEGTYFALRRAIHPVPELGSIGLNDNVVRYLRHIGKVGSGLILLSGETGQGKTTTICSMLIDFLTNFGDIAVTIEDPPELKLHGKHGDSGYCWQTQVKDGDFGASIKQTMRYNPRYILLGEIRSAGEASEALRAAINGHLVLTSIHAGSVQEAINALLKKIAGREPLDLARSVLADGLASVVQQKLVRQKDRMHLRSQFIFTGNSSSVRTKIREGKVEQLSSDIENQANRVMSGRAPIGN